MMRLTGLARAALGLAAFLALWELVPRLGLVNPAFLPPPSAIPPAFWKEVVSGAWGTISSAFSPGRAWARSSAS